MHLIQEKFHAVIRVMWAWYIGFYCYVTKEVKRSTPETSICLNELFIVTAPSSYRPCPVALVVLPVYSLLSRVLPIISDTDAPPWHYVYLFRTRSRCLLCFSSTLYFPVCCHSSEFLPFPDVPTECGLPFPEASNLHRPAKYLFFYMKPRLSHLLKLRLKKTT